MGREEKEKLEPIAEIIKTKRDKEMFSMGFQSALESMMGWHERDYNKLYNSMDALLGKIKTIDIEEVQQ